MMMKKKSGIGVPITCTQPAITPIAILCKINPGLFGEKAGVFAYRPSIAPFVGAFSRSYCMGNEKLL